MKKAQLVLWIILLSTYATVSEPLAIFPTKIKVTVLDDSGNLVIGALVQLYKTKDDYLSNQNVQFEAVTNKKGIAVINNIESTPYFIEASKGTQKNYGKGVQVEKINQGKTNKVNIIIE